MDILFSLSLKDVEDDLKLQGILVSQTLSDIWTSVISALQADQDSKHIIKKFEKKWNDTMPGRNPIDFKKKYPLYWQARQHLLSDDFLRDGHGNSPVTPITKPSQNTGSELSQIGDKIDKLMKVLEIDMSKQLPQHDVDLRVMQLNAIQETVYSLPRQRESLESLLQDLKRMKNLICPHSTDIPITNDSSVTIDDRLNQLKTITEEIASSIAALTNIGKRELSVRDFTNRPDNERLEESLKQSTGQKSYSQDTTSDHGERKVIEKLRKEIEELKKQIEAFVENERDLKSALQSAQADKNHWISRVSEVTSTKMKDNNPNITDLSDPNRPQKLAEQYGELYDNAWTEAFEKLTSNMKEKDALILLCSNLKDCYDQCELHAKKQIVDLERNILQQMTGKQQKVGQSEIISLRKALRDAQRAVPVSVESGMIKMIQQKLNKEAKKYSKVPESFVLASLTICWGMVAHDPPLVFMYPECGREKKIDLDNVTLYTRSGEGIQVVVWPTMLLYQGGPVLRKGVIQPYEKRK